MACRPAAARPIRTAVLLCVCRPSHPHRPSFLALPWPLSQQDLYAASQHPPQASSLSETLMASQDHCFLCIF